VTLRNGNVHPQASRRVETVDAEARDASGDGKRARAESFGAGARGAVGTMNAVSLFAVVGRLT
jgi:hypothetical protein